MDRYGDAVLRTAYFYLKDKQRAEDAYQETFLRVYRALDKLRDHADPKPWILKVAINVCRDMRRSAWWRRVLLVDRADSETAAGDSAEHGAMAAEESRELYQSVTRMSEPFRTVVLLYYYHDLTTLEIGGMLQVAEGTVRSRLHRARLMLRHDLERTKERGGGR